MFSKRSVVFLAAVALAAGLGGALVARHLGRGPTVTLQAGTYFAEPRRIQPFRLTDQDGMPFDNARLANGAPSLLFFGFTHCPDVCPTTLAVLAGLERRAPLPGLRTLFVTVDPERDNQTLMKQYVTAFSSTLTGLRGEESALAPLMRSLSAVSAVQKTPDGSYSVDHSSALYLIDGHGRLAAVFTPPFSVPALESDLRLAARALDR
jgi:protein SCO1/2